MREFLDAILEFIGSESLTDEEYASTATLGLTQSYTLKVYLALKAIMSDREEVSTQLDKLKFYFQAKGVTIDTPAKTPKSNIFVGGSLSGFTVTTGGGTPDPDPTPPPDPGEAITELTGEVTAVGPGSASAVVSNTAVITKLLTGFSAAAGTVSGSDTIRGAFNKVVGNIAALASTVGGFASAISTLQSDVGDVEDDVGTLQGTVATVQGDLGDVESDVSSLQSTVTGLAPKDSPTFSTKAVFNFATASTVALFNASKELVSLAVGTNGYVLTLVGGVPAWAAAAGGLAISGVDNALVRVNGTTGIQDGPVFVSDLTSDTGSVYTSGASLTLSAGGTKTSPGGTSGWLDLCSPSRIRMIIDAYSTTIGAVEWSGLRAFHRIPVCFDGTYGIGKRTDGTLERPNEVHVENWVGVAAGSSPTNASVGFEIGGTALAILFPRMTGTQRDALTAVNGMAVYNTSTDKLQVRAGGAWVDLH